MLTGRPTKRTKGLEPTISTIILFGIVGVVGFTVAYWLQGVTSEYAKFERIEIQSGVCLGQTTNGGTYWKIELQLKNPGTVTVTFTGISMNDIEIKRYDHDGNMIQGTSTSMVKDETLDIGRFKVYSIYIDDEYPSSVSPYTSGVIVTLRLHTAGGMEYMRTMELV